MHVVYIQLMSQRRHVYIYHSLDYGETFNVYHPVSIGPDPIFANFIAEDTLVEPDDTVQFTDLSNDAETWEWDFDNDGTIDSYEQNPIYIYQDTGYYTVKLMITGYGGVIEDYGIRYDYIHVDDFTGEKNIEQEQKVVNLYPNPVKDQVTIEFYVSTSSQVSIQISEPTGKAVKTIRTGTRSQGDHRIECSTAELENGLYYVTLYVNRSTAGTGKFVKVE